MKKSTLLLLIGCAYAHITQANPIPSTTLDFRMHILRQVTDEHTARTTAQKISDYESASVTFAQAAQLNRKKYAQPQVTPCTTK